MSRTTSLAARWVGILLALFACLATVAIPASASDPEDRLQRLQERREQVGDKIRSTHRRGASLDSRIDVLDRRAEDIQGQITALETNIAALDDRISVTQDRLSEAQQRLAYLSDELLDVQAQLADRTEALTRRAIDLYKAGPGAPVGGLVSSESFSDLVDRYAYYESALDADAELLDEIEVLRSVTEDRRAEVEAKKEEIAAAKLQLEADRGGRSRKRPKGGRPRGPRDLDRREGGGP